MGGPFRCEDAPRGLQQYPHAIGLDTNCCNGGQLTVSSSWKFLHHFLSSPGDCGRALLPMLLYMSAYNVAMFLGTYVLSTLDRLSGQMGEIILF